MTLRDLVPWKRDKNEICLRKDYEHPFMGLQREMNELFDSFFRGFGLEPFRSIKPRLGSFMPKINVTENDKEIHISAELPGMEQEDIELTLGKDSLTIAGEKKDEYEDKGKDYYRMERSYGSFHRVIPLPAEIDDTKAEAEFKKGVLKIKLPKTVEAQASRKKIEIKSG